MRLLGFEVIQTPALPCRLKGQPCLVWKVQGVYPSPIQEYPCNVFDQGK